MGKKKTCPVGLVLGWLDGDAEIEGLALGNVRRRWDWWCRAGHDADAAGLDATGSMERSAPEVSPAPAVPGPQAALSPHPLPAMPNATE